MRTCNPGAFSRITSSGKWCDYKQCSAGTSNVFTQTGCSGAVTAGAAFTFTVSGDVLTASKSFYNGLVGSLEQSDPTDLIKWANGADWYRNHTA